MDTPTISTKRRKFNRACLFVFALCLIATGLFMKTEKAEAKIIYEEVFLECENPGIFVPKPIKHPQETIV